MQFERNHRQALVIIERVNNRSWHNLAQFIAALGFISLGLVLFIATINPPSGSYNTNIYHAYPTALWVLLILAVNLGISSTLIEILVTRRPYSWIYGFLIVSFSSIFILVLPYLLGYAFVTQRDDVEHFSHVMTIIEHAHIGSTNFYPISHILSAIIFHFTDTSPEVIVLLFPLLYFLFYLAGTAFLAWTVTSRPQVRGLIMLLATPLIFGTYGTNFRTTHFAVYMLPFFLAFLYRTQFQNRGVAYAVPLVLFLFVMPFMHPWAVIATAGLILAYVIFSRFEKGQDGYFVNTERLFTTLSIIIIIWLTWFMSFRVFGRTTERIIQSFLEAIGPNLSFNHYVSIAERAQLSLYTIFSIITFRYGAALLYYIPVGVIIVWGLVGYLKRNHQISIHIASLAAFIVVFGSLAAISLFRDLVTQSPIRLLNFASVCVPLLLGLCIKKILSRSKSNLATSSLLTVVFLSLFSASTLGFFSSYDSPYSGSSSTSFPYSQMVGHAFFTQQAADDGARIYTPFEGAKNLNSVVNFKDLQKLRQKSLMWTIQLAPAHFEFDVNLSSITFENPIYLWIAAYERAYYTEVWPEGGSFTPDDFQTLEIGGNWSKIYVSGGLDIFRSTSFVHSD